MDTPSPALTWANVHQLLGPRAARLAFTAVAIAVTLGALELVLAGTLQVFLVATGVASPSLLPGWAGRARSFDVATVTALLLLVGFLRSLGNFLQTHLAHAAGELVLARVRAAAIHAHLFPQGPVPDARTMAAVRYHDTANRNQAWVLSVVLLGAALLQAAAIFLALVWVAPSLAAVALVLLALGAVLVRAAQGRVRALAAAQPALAKEQAANWERVLRNRIFITLVRMEAPEEQRLVAGLRRLQGHTLHQLTVQNAVGAFIPFLGVTVLVAVVLLGVTVLRVEGLQLLAFLYLLFRLVGQAQAAAGTAVNIQVQLPHVRTALALLHAQDQAAMPALLDAVGSTSLWGARAGQAIATPVAPPPRAGPAQPPVVTLDTVAFAYPGGKAPVIRDFSLHVPSGAQVALVGQSGAGKSTLLLLLLGLLKPDRGVVHVGGSAPLDWRARSNARLGYVGPDPYVIHGTVADNLRYGGDPHASDEALLEALREAHLETLATPEGLRRVVTEEAEGLSAGQKQRLCLARALLLDPDLLILDEATANVDDETERLIADSLRQRKGRCTTVVVTHRRGLLAHADNVVELSTSPGA